MAMNDKEKSLKAKFEAAKTARSPYESGWEGIAAIIRPLRVNIQSQRTPGQNNRTRIYNGEPERANDRLGADLYSSMTNPASRWFDFTDEDPDLMKFGPVAKWLNRTTKITHRTLRPEHSQFYAEMPGFYTDYSAFGTGFFWSERVAGTNRFIDQTRAIGEMYIMANAEGVIDQFFREYKTTARAIEQQFGQGGDLPESVTRALKTEAGQNQEFTVVHVTLPNADFQSNKFGLAGKKWVSIYLVVEANYKIISEKGYDAQPAFAPRLDKMAGEVYGRGVGDKMMADAGMLQAQSETMLRAAQLVAEPPMAAADRSVLRDPVMMAPRHVNYGAINRQGKPLIQPIALSGSLPVTQQVIDKTVEAVKSSAFFFLTSLTNRTGLSPEEFLQIDEERLKLLGPMYGRLQNEFLSPFIDRRFEMLRRAGAFPPPPPELEGRELKVSYRGPMESAQKSRSGANTMRFARAVGEIAQLKPEALDKFDADKAIDVLAESFSPDPEVVVDQRQVDKIRADRAQQQQQVQALAAGEQGADIAAKLAGAGASAAQAQNAGQGGG